MRVADDVKKLRAGGELPSIEEIQRRYQFTEDAAREFIASIRRAAAKPAPSAAGRSRSTTSSPNGRKPVSLGELLSPANPSKGAVLAAILADIRQRFGDEIRQKGEQTQVREGFVYLVVHPCFDGWIKAGMTIDFELRLATYNVADPLSRFRMVAISWVPDRRASEKSLLLALSEVATEFRGEWFLTSFEDAKSIFDRLNSSA